MYIHVFIFVNLRGIDLNNMILFLILGVLIPTLIHFLLSKLNILSKFFLGEENEGKGVFNFTLKRNSTL
ncbi:hypothetical protein SAMN04487988_12215 [Algoriphagus hitonicola]|uniref:Uncharacterized protein n=1 Tax=Algoriphagus hitonicola TaxID=435880 RepID=A0A1I2XTF8_9BACT|nr:hypothetical protein SAMN04487988_12215 [Algoriphagus hitonicola]